MNISFKRNEGSYTDGSFVKTSMTAYTPQEGKVNLNKRLLAKIVYPTKKVRNQLIIILINIIFNNPTLKTSNRFLKMNFYV